ncbi:c-type cytochrome [Kaistia algarum]|uniref:c-type cytochrome n=1 Tax=Kaistia algarum TaxID=2083279 RepID=UPI0022574514|nr:cytochrome c [Kaistia algarum]
MLRSTITTASSLRYWMAFALKASPAASDSSRWVQHHERNPDMRGLLVAASIVVALATGGAAMAASDLGAQREADMKAIGSSLKTGFDMVQGKTDFDAAKAKAAMEKIAAKATEFPTLFPAGSEKVDSKASPDIWTNKADFEAHAAKLATDATAAAAAAGNGLDAFKPALVAVAANCKACHQTYRLSD